MPTACGRVPRARTITLEALNQEGKKVRGKAEGFHARILQHEVDHLNGLFYLDRMKDLKSWRHLEEFNLLCNSHVRDSKGKGP